MTTPRDMAKAHLAAYARNVAGLMALAAVSACAAPAYERGSHIPAEAKLEHWPKIGWGWALCLDAASDSALFTWGAEGGAGPFIQLRQTTCSAGSDPRDVLRAKGSAGGIEFLFPEASDKGALFGDEGCPHQVSQESLARFGNVLSAAISSGRLTPEAAAEAEGMQTAIGRVEPDRLRQSGGEGNSDAWSIRCKPS